MMDQRANMLKSRTYPSLLPKHLVSPSYNLLSHALQATSATYRAVEADAEAAHTAALAALEAKYVQTLAAEMTALDALRAKKRASDIAFAARVAATAAGGEADMEALADEYAGRLAVGGEEEVGDGRWGSTCV